jgi:hydroxymethylglutaryl-CoA reductase
MYIFNRKFRKQTIYERREELIQIEPKPTDLELSASNPGKDLLDLANIMVENAYGTFAIPLGIAQGFLIDGAEVNLPMATEEPSVIAAASYAGTIITKSGGFTTWGGSTEMTAQIYLLGAKKEHCELIQSKEEEIKKLIQPILSGMEKRGGGYRSLDCHWFDSKQVLRIHVHIDVKDAMGANILNTAAESLTPYLEDLCKASKILAILSNEASQHSAGAKFSIALNELNRAGYKGREMAERIVSAYDIADLDPARAVTHNKGIMNGITALALATGNDTRGLEAAAHRAAVRDGQYRSLSKFWIENEHLHGSLELPISLGTVGGAVSFHPGAQLNLKILGKPSSSQLMRYAAALGLAQNYAALSALATEGIQSGHMKKHAARLAYQVGARGDFIPKVQDYLMEKNKFNLEIAKQALEELK